MGKSDPGTGPKGKSGTRGPGAGPRFVTIIAERSAQKRKGDLSPLDSDPGTGDPTFDTKMGKYNAETWKTNDRDPHI